MGDESLVKVKNLELDDSDVLMCYSDGLIEAKNVK
ncbi:MAG: serine/threonine-protein phosphatase [Candidatus Peribacteria bacterium]|jgi:serine phosphatase RsbU (regulator of sigma subunit)|nr:serine/threonine-protein phosphatase [Candidatus Peribacteria bacterium]